MNDNNMPINIQPFLIIALGCNEKLHKTIDEMYRDNKLEYYRLFRESEYYNDETILRYTAKKVQYMQKVVGMLLWDYVNETNKNAFYLIKKGYKHIWNYMKNRNGFELTDLARYSGKYRGGTNTVSDFQVFLDVVVGIFIGLENNIFIDDNSYYGELFNITLRDYLMEVDNENIRFSNENIDKNKEEINYLLNNYNIAGNKQMTLETLFGIQFMNTCENIAKTQVGQLRLDELKDASFRNGTSKYINALSGWIKYLGVNEMDFILSCVLSAKDMEKVMLEYLMAKEKNNITEENRDLFIMTCLWIKAIVDEYNKTKRIYLQDLQEEMFYEVNKAKEEIAEKKNELIKKEVKIDNENARLKEEIAKLRAELQASEKNNNSLQKELQNVKDNSKELTALRETIFYVQNVEVDISPNEEQFEELIEEISGKKVAILGGNVVWLNRIKELLPNYLTIDTNKKSLDFSFLDNMDAVFLNTSTMSHSFYERVMARMSKNNTKMFYLSSNTNIKLTIKNIYDNLFRG